MTIRVTRIFYYPVESCRARETMCASVGEAGIFFDHRWMVVDRNCNFMTQRQHPRMARINAENYPGVLTMRAPKMPYLHVSYDEHLMHADGVAAVWGDQCLVWDEGSKAAEWFTEFMGEPCRLVQIHPEDLRRSKSGKSRIRAHDAYPFLVVSEDSFNDLRRRLPEDLVRMDQFRPTLVVSGCDPYAEDAWNEIRIGSVTFLGGSVCLRCPVIQTDQCTGRRGKEPTRTLLTYRRVEVVEGGKKKVKTYLGKNLDHIFAPGQRYGMIRVGDEVRVIH